MRSSRKTCSFSSTITDSQYFEDEDGVDRVKHLRAHGHGDPPLRRLQRKNDVCVSAYLVGAIYIKPPNRSSRCQPVSGPFANMLMFLLPTLACGLTLSHAGRRAHDRHFAPTHILRATSQNITVDCQSRTSVVINGSDPGPTIQLREGEEHWIRVYNNILDRNLTIHWHGL